MTLRQSANPYGYPPVPNRYVRAGKNLLVYQKAESMQQACAEFTRTFPKEKTLVALADQMDRSARSVKQNIVEGCPPERLTSFSRAGKRNGTKEYYDFLGFSIGANAELEEDCDDILKGRYESLKGIMEERGVMGIEEVDRLPFYPLDSHLPPLVQLKLRCKELNLLLSKLQKSLAEKMATENRLPGADRLALSRKQQAAEDDWFARSLEEQGLIRLPNGQIVPKKSSP